MIQLNVSYWGILRTWKHDDYDQVDLLNQHTHAGDEKNVPSFILLQTLLWCHIQVVSEDFTRLLKARLLELKLKG